MNPRYRNKYRSDSTRLQTWNYGWEAAYFITICTKGREFFFGDIVDGEMILNEIGKIVQSEWFKTFEMRPDMNLAMGEFIVMPDHFHAIIGIGDNEFTKKKGGYKSKYNIEYDPDKDPDQGTGATHCASTSSSSSASAPTESSSTPSTSTSSESANRSKNKFGPQSKNLAAIIRGLNPV